MHTEICGFRYIESPRHVILMGIGDYPILDASGVQTGREKCWLYQRCWAVFEMAIRDCIAVRLLKHNRSEIIVMDETFQEIESESGRCICEAIIDRFRTTDFFGSMRGRPGDVEEIQRVLVSPDFYRSEEEFNEHHRKRIVALLTENIPKVSRSKSLSNFGWCVRTDAEHSFCSSRLIH